LYDIIFCTLPVAAIDQIYSAPPLLKGIVQSAGFKARTVDFSMDLFNFCDRNLDQFSDIQNHFISNDTELTIKQQAILNQWYDHVIKTIKSMDTKYIGFSVFSYWTHVATIEILKRLNELGMTDRVVLGGRGLKTTTNDKALASLPNRNINDSIEWFADVLKRKGLIKHTIIGDGENSIVEFLKTNIISQQNYVAQGFDFPYPNYDDYNFDNYMWANGEQSLQVIGSKGCVRDCDFCDVKVQFGNYQFKDGTQLANEMIHLQKQFGINKFALVDSLSNGSMKHFLQFINRLSEHNLSYTTPPISWNGQYICKEYKDSEKTDIYYKKLKASGAEGLTIGAESGSNYVLENMNKKTTVEALFSELEKFRENNITCVLLTFPGHWSERPEDFVEHCEMLINLVPYVRSGTVSGISLGESFQLLHETPSWNNPTVIKHKEYFGRVWVASTNTGNTLKTRVKRKLATEKLAAILRLPTFDDTANLLSEYNFIKDRQDEINQFFKKHGTVDANGIQDIDVFVDELINSKNDLEIKMEIEVSSTETDPGILVKLNDTVLENKLIPAGLQQLTFTVSKDNLDRNNLFSIELLNKLPTDTMVDQSGQIIKDKFIVIKSLYIDNCDILKDFDFFNREFYTVRDGIVENPNTGLWFNGQSLNLKFQAPFKIWYSQHSDKNLNSSWLKDKNDQVKNRSQVYYDKLLHLLETLEL